MNRPSGLGRVIQMAQRIESKNQTLKYFKGSTYGGNKGGYAENGGGSKRAMGSTSRGTIPMEKTPRHRTVALFKRMSDVEMQMM